MTFQSQVCNGTIGVFNFVQSGLEMEGSPAELAVRYMSGWLAEKNVFLGNVEFDPSDLERTAQNVHQAVHQATSAR
jgi:hypothetical protein